MHRTTTTATLLVTVAVSALSGCVTVQRPPASGPAAAPSRPSAPRPDGSAEPRIVQAPAREALELIGRPRTPKPAVRSQAPAASTPPTEQHRRPSPHSRTHHQPHPAPRHPSQARPPRIELPDVSQSVPKNSDVCALGRRYGGWKADSPEATICRQAYVR
ncbi:hypothetical protein ABZV31_21745 [Streptomyces sp. NPDC005202]|uniref:hypothetical protein n=1 Tax=Streptomyces sp. NPDC005202 TaxID=3157021 RepID=UPI0033A87E66